MRIPMVTRTVKSTRVLVLLADVEANALVEKRIDIPRTYSDEKSLIKAVKSALANEPLTFVKVLATAEQEALYGMSEQKFISLAQVLPPRGTQNDD